jgi:hypothetical protein
MGPRALHHGGADLGRTDRETGFARLRDRTGAETFLLNRATALKRIAATVTAGAAGRRGFGFDDIGQKGSGPDDQTGGVNAPTAPRLRPRRIGRTTVRAMSHSEASPFGEGQGPRWMMVSQVGRRCDSGLIAQPVRLVIIEGFLGWRAPAQKPRAVRLRPKRQASGDDNHTGLPRRAFRRSQRLARIVRAGAPVPEANGPCRRMNESASASGPEGPGPSWGKVFDRAAEEPREGGGFVQSSLGVFSFHSRLHQARPGAASDIGPRRSTR